ncbi:DedA family protein [Symbioplanes lichenis]|uniref:DedA family protein n=1 Tax=Symbioplanes lichenis TaxID=1629072 RepID=UPI002738656A|nr:VTT domain-containing protein [Actinoplanes lichenis]
MPADLMHAATAFVEWLATLGTVPVLAVLLLSSAVEMTFLLGLLIPGESVVMIAAALPRTPAGVLLVVTVGTAGALGGQILGYAVGRAWGPRLRTTRLGRRIGPARFDSAEAYLRSRGGPALALVRFVAVIHAVVPIVAGSVRMPFGRFVAWSALGTVLWVGAFAGVGVATSGAGASGSVALVLTAIGATCLGAVPAAARLVRRRRPRRRPLRRRESVISVA